MVINVNLGLLLLRLGTGTLFTMYGFGKLSKGAETWAVIGSALSNLGINFAQTQIGLGVALVELIGGLCLIIGLFVRPVSLLLLFTMLGAINFHINNGDSFQIYSHALQVAIIFLALFFTGGGESSLDAKRAKIR